MRASRPRWHARCDGARSPPVDGPAVAPAEMGVLLLDAQLRPCGATNAARAWLRALEPAGTPYPDGIPRSRLERRRQADGGRARRGSRAAGAGPRAHASHGRWAIVEAARLDGRDGGIAVSIRAAGRRRRARSSSPAPTGLTPRECELVVLLVEGLDTRRARRRLVISRHTVQDHLKSVFAKAGVRSRRELVSSVVAQAS